MLDLLRLAAVFVLVVFLLRRKLNVGLVLILGAASLSLLYLMPPSSVIRALTGAMTSDSTIKLAVALSAIRAFELVLRERGVMSSMMEASRALLSNRKAVMVSMPLLIGMLPSVGGAYFSAPMVEESAKGTNMPPEEKAFVNYWYRHPWEYILPLYPGVLLASTISGIELWTLILANLPYALAIAASGFLFSMRGIKGKVKSDRLSRKGLFSFLPVSLVLAAVVVLRMELYIALLIVLIGLLIVYRYALKDLYKVVKYGVSSDVLLLIAGVMLFKGMMESSGAVKNLSLFFSESGIPLMPMLFLLPFITGLLTGLTLGFVGAAFPLLTSLSGEPWAISFAFGAGFVGVLLSPVHVCLVLTREYFKADMSGIYRRMIPAAMLILIVAAAQYLLLSG